MNTSCPPKFWMVLSIVVGTLTAGAFLPSCAWAPSGERAVVVYRNYVPPPWAPPYDNVSTIRYYYLPDYDVYYDVWQGTFCYQTGAMWICSATLPPMYADVNLYGVFLVLIHRDIARPWLHDRYYHDNYPPHCYDRYPDIVMHQRIISDVPSDRELVPRAFNENSDRVTFMRIPRERRAATPAPQPLPNAPSPQAPAPQAPAPLPNVPSRPPAPAPTPAPTPRTPGTGTSRAPAPPPARVAAPNYDRVVQEVPMRAITPSMPPASKKYNYGSGYVGQPKQR